MRADDVRCPFCVLDSRARGFAVAVTFGATIGACSAREIDTSAHTEPSTSSPIDTGDAASSAATTNATTPSTTVMSETGPVDTAAESSDGDEGQSCGFYGGCPFDGGGTSLECDIWAQDCPRGEKCMPWANDGVGAWNATRCSPLDPNPAEVGEPCTVEGSGVSGIDNCSLGAMCWNVDDETNVGTCVDLCLGSTANPICTNPELSCRVLNDGVLILCLPECDPLMQDCSNGDGCYLADQAFVCLPPNERPAMVGDSCIYIGECEAGLHCVESKSLFDCPLSGCCTEICDLQAPDPDAACSGAANGEVCTLLLDDGKHPNVGICRLPD